MLSQAPVAVLTEKAPTIAYLFTTFPKSTETFLQREIIGMQARGANLRIYSLHGGGGGFRGLSVERFSKWRLVELIWKIPLESVRRPRVLLELLCGLATRRAPSWMNFWENMLGAGFACVYARHFRKNPPGLIHAAWGGAPATAAWILWRSDGHRYSAAAHAYEIYYHGGDWWLREKLLPAAFVHTSTEMGWRALIGHGVPADKIICIRRGLDALPPLKPLRTPRTSLRLVCVARLVEKKDCAINSISMPRYATRVLLLKRASPATVRCAPNSRRGRANCASPVALFSPVICRGRKSWINLPGPMCSFTLASLPPAATATACRTSFPRRCRPACWWSPRRRAATTEAVIDGVTGLVAPVDEPEAWLTALRRLATDDRFAESLRVAAHRWVEENFDAHKNAALILAQFEQAISNPDLNRNPP